MMVSGKSIISKSNLSSRNHQKNQTLSGMSNWATKISSNVKTIKKNTEKPLEISSETIILSIFIYHSEFSIIEYEFFITYNSVFLLYKNSPSIRKKFKFSELELILKTINPSGTKINFEQFSTFILCLVNKAEPIKFALNSRQTYIQLISIFFREYYNKIMEGSCKNRNNYFNIYSNIKNIVLNESITVIIKSILPTLKQIYFSYFKYEINKYINQLKIFKQSLKSFLEFTKHYDICPFYFSINQIAMYFYLIMEKENIFQFVDHDFGTLFTFNKFCTAFCIIGINVIELIGEKLIKGEKQIDKDKECILKYKNFSNEEKLLQFLSKIQLSKGIEYNSRKRSLTMNLSFSQLIPNNDVLNLISPNFNTTFSKSCYSKIWNCLTVTGESSFCNTPNLASTTVKTSTNQENTILFHKFDKYHSYLKSIFSYYTNSTDKFQFSQMGLSDFKKFIKDFGIIKHKTKKVKRSSSLTPIFSSANVSNIYNNTSYNLNFVSRNDSRRNNYIDLNFPDKSHNGLSNLDEESLEILFADLCGSKNNDKGNSVFENISVLKGLNETLNVQKKMNYTNFLKAIEIIAQKIYYDSLSKNKKSTNINLNESIPFFFENEINEQLTCFIEKQNKKKDIMNKLNYIKEGQLYNILNVLKPIIGKYYQAYAIDGLLTFDTFFKIYRDFGVFPEMTSLILMKNVFFTLADQKELEEYHNSFLKMIQLTNKKDFKFKPQNEKNINLELFMFSLGIIALSIDTTLKLTDIEKISLLFENIAQSWGKNKTQQETGITL